MSLTRCQVMLVVLAWGPKRQKKGLRREIKFSLDILL
jgi:hypothetical protein